MISFAKHKKSPYLLPGRLADVLALIQVLALDKRTHRTNDELKDELQGTPKSEKSWSELAQQHPEFFRVNPDSDHPVSLLARHVIPKDEKSDTRPFSSDYASKLFQLAVELHDPEIRRSQDWQVWLPVLGVVLGGGLALLGVWLKSQLEVAPPTNSCTRPSMSVGFPTIKVTRAHVGGGI